MTNNRYIAAIGLTPHSSSIHSWHFRFLFISTLYFVGQVLTGTELYVSAMFSIAIFFGLCAIPAAGGLRTAFGLLNAALIVKFLLIGIAFKVLTFQAADLNLLAPDTTATVMALGFLGLLIGSVLQSRLPCTRIPFVPGIDKARTYLALTIVAVAASYAGYLIGLYPEFTGQGVQTGGILGFARMLSTFRSFCIVPALFFAWSRGGSRFLTHPLVLAVLALGGFAGVFSTSKLDAMEPLLFYMLVGVLRYGLKHRGLWTIAVLGTAYYALVIYPYSQYVRNAGGREGTFSERMVVTREVFWSVVTDADFRRFVSSRIITKKTYLGEGAFSPFSRFAMVGEADRLIAATDEKQTFTGWETIIWGFRLLTPSWLYSEKPIYGTGNYLGHIADDIGSSDRTTQISYGVMANLYNAFSYSGVFIGSIVFFGSFYYLFRFFFSNPTWNRSPVGSTIWYLLIVVMFQHNLVESSMANLIASCSLPLVTMLIYRAGRCIYPFLPNFRDGVASGRSQQTPSIRKSILRLA